MYAETAVRHEDTIAAIATPTGVGGIGIVRISGTQAKQILQAVFVPALQHFQDFRPWTLHHGHCVDAHNHAFDDVLAVFMPAPRTFTGEDVAEIHCHGGYILTQTLLEVVLSRGARLARKGEFSRRALLNGRMDLTQAEAVAESIAAPSRQALRFAAAKLEGLLGQRVSALRHKLEHVRMALCAAVDFPEEEMECLAPQEFAAVVEEVRQAITPLLQSYQRGRCWQQGAHVVLAGAVNAGKSSLMNALLGRNRALVTDVPGTTRDFLEEYIYVQNLPIRLVDTAGLRQSNDAIEREGIARSHTLVQQADVIVYVLDGSTTEGENEGRACIAAAQAPVLLVWNKADIAPQVRIPAWWQERAAHVAVVSAITGEGVEQLAQDICALVLAQGGGEPQEGDIAPNMRQAHALQKALQELTCLQDDILSAVPYDVCAVRLDAAVAILGEVTGVNTPAEVLDGIFSTFCIGK